VSGAKNGGPILTVYMSYDVFLHKELLFGSCDDWICFKILSGIIFLKLQLIL